MELVVVRQGAQVSAGACQRDTRRWLTTLSPAAPETMSCQRLLSCAAETQAIWKHHSHVFLALEHPWLQRVAIVRCRSVSARQPDNQTIKLDFKKVVAKVY